MFFIFLLLIFLTFLVFVSFIFLFFHLITIFTGAPYLGTTTRRVGEMIKLSRVKAGERAVDLGCGDGRIVIALAKAGAYAYGYELNPFYVLLARWKIFRAGLSGRANVYWKNFFDANLSSFDIITVYGISYMMDKLKNKLEKELSPSTRIVSSSFVFPMWKPVKMKKYVYVYHVNVH